MEHEIVIEIPKNSKVKYEIVNNRIYVDRILYGAYVYPMNYGYFENTLDWDGDPLDGLVIADQSFVPGAIVKVRIIGAVKMIDAGETDTKIIAVIVNDPRYTHIKTTSDLNSHILKELKDFFENYKNLQNKKVVIDGFENEAYAINEIEETTELFNKYHEWDKDEFVAKMKKLHPNKYPN